MPYYGHNLRNILAKSYKLGCFFEQPWLNPNAKYRRLLVNGLSGHKLLATFESIKSRGTGSKYEIKRLDALITGLFYNKNILDKTYVKVVTKVSLI